MSFLVASVQNPPKGNDITVDKRSENKWIKQVFFIPLTFSTKGDILEKWKLLHISPFFLIGQSLVEHTFFKFNSVPQAPK